MTSSDVTDKRETSGVRCPTTVRTVRRAAVALALLVGAGCNKTPDEPDKPAAATSATPAVAPLTWEAPGTWTVLETPRSGAKKAAYKIPHVGADKEDAELSVLFYGTGANGDAEKVFKEWFDQFDGNVGPTAKRETFDVGTAKVETVEVAGTWKMSLTPPVGPKKKSPVQMVKENWRLVGAVVKTPDRGNWFFKITGPDETVQASRATFRTLLESAK